MWPPVSPLSLEMFPCTTSPPSEPLFSSFPPRSVTQVPLPPLARTSRTPTAASTSPALRPYSTFSSQSTMVGRLTGATHLPCAVTSRKVLPSISLRPKSSNKRSRPKPPNLATFSKVNAIEAFRLQALLSLACDPSIVGIVAIYGENFLNCLTPLFSIPVICSETGCIEIQQHLTLAVDLREQIIIGINQRRICAKSKQLWQDARDLSRTHPCGIFNAWVIVSHRVGACCIAFQAVSASDPRRQQSGWRRNSDCLQRSTHTALHKTAGYLMDVEVDGRIRTN